MDHYNFLLYIKMSETIYYQRNRGVIPNGAKNDKEWLRDNARDKEIYLKKKKMKRENMEEIDITICLKKINKD